MPVYAKRLNWRQRWLLAEYERRTGFEAMHQEELDAGEMTFEELWSANVDFIEMLLAEITNLPKRGTGL